MIKVNAVVKQLCISFKGSNRVWLVVQVLTTSVFRMMMMLAGVQIPNLVVHGEFNHLMLAYAFTQWWGMNGWRMRVSEIRITIQIINNANRTVQRPIYWDLPNTDVSSFPPRPSQTGRPRQTGRGDDTKKNNKKRRITDSFRVREEIEYWLESVRRALLTLLLMLILLSRLVITSWSVWSERA